MAPPGAPPKAAQVGHQTHLHGLRSWREKIFDLNSPVEASQSVVKPFHGCATVLLTQSWTQDGAAEETFHLISGPDRNAREARQLPTTTDPLGGAANTAAFPFSFGRILFGITGIPNFPWLWPTRPRSYGAWRNLRSRRLELCRPIPWKPRIG